MIPNHLNRLIKCSLFGYLVHSGRQVTDSEVLDMPWRETPEWNVGVSLGKKNVVVVVVVNYKINI